MTSFASHGYHLARQILSPPDVLSLRDAIGETINRVARAFLAPFEMSCPDAPLEERLDRAAQTDRGYATALFRAVMADAHRDPRVEALCTHPRLTAVVRDLLHPAARTGQVIRPRAVLPTFA